MLGSYAKAEITREELIRQMAGGAVAGSTSSSTSSSRSSRNELARCPPSRRTDWRRPLRRAGRRAVHRSADVCRSRSAAARPTSPSPPRGQACGRGCFTAVGDDELGRYARSALERFGVETRFVGVHPTLPTPIVIAAMEDPENPWFVFRREPKAPDLEITLEEVDREVAHYRSDPLDHRRGAVGGADAVGRAGASRRPGPAAPRRARPRLPPLVLAQRGRSAHDHRRRRRPRDRGGRQRAECEIAVGTSDPDAAADALLGRGVALAIVKQGRDGVLVATAVARRSPVPVEVVSGLGAGDAFERRAVPRACSPAGRRSSWSSSQTPPARSSPRRLLCADAMPTEAEVRELLEESRARR